MRDTCSDHCFVCISLAVLIYLCLSVAYVAFVHVRFDSASRRSLARKEPNVRLDMQGAWNWYLRANVWMKTKWITPVLSDDCLVVVRLMLVDAAVPAYLTIFTRVIHRALGDPTYIWRKTATAQWNLCGRHISSAWLMSQSIWRRTEQPIDWFTNCQLEIGSCRTSTHHCDHKHGWVLQRSSRTHQLQM